MIEKIDIIGTAVYCYDDQYALIKTLELSQFQGIDFSYLGEYKMLTFNIFQPIKRIVKYTELNSLDLQAEFTEYPYADMTAGEQAQFDSFVQQAESL